MDLNWVAHILRNRPTKKSKSREIAIYDDDSDEIVYEDEVRDAEQQLEQFLDLPPDIIKKIILDVDDIQTVIILSVVSPKFNRVANLSDVWYELLKGHAGEKWALQARAAKNGILRKIKINDVSYRNFFFAYNFLKMFDILEQPKKTVLTLEKPYKNDTQFIEFQGPAEFLYRILEYNVLNRLRYAIRRIMPGNGIERSSGSVALNVDDHPTFNKAILVAVMFSLGFKSNINPDTDEDTRTYTVGCNVCENDAKFMCSQCDSALYCSKKCQEHDWAKGHSEECYYKI